MPPLSQLHGGPAPLPAHRTVDAALDHAASGRFGLTFVDLREQERPMDWALVRARAGRIACALAELGVRRGDRVAMVLPTSEDFVAGFFGALRAGAVAVPLYPPVRLGRMEEYHQATSRMLEVSDSRLLLTDGRVRLLLGRSVARARLPLGMWTVGALEERGGGAHQEAVAPGELALIQFSSGSTVEPKAVALTHGQLVHQCAALRALMPEPAEEGALGVSWLPLYHDMGLIGCLVLAAYHPGPLVLLPPEVFLARPALWLRALSRHRGTVSPAPNFAYGLCLKRVRDEDLQGVELSSWRYALNGAEPVSAEVLRRFVERFARFGLDPASLMPVYGLSEASLAVTFSPRRSPPALLRVDGEALARGEVAAGSRPLVSVGQPVPGVGIRVVGASGRPLEEGRVGRIQVSGPSVMEGYFGAPEATARAVKDGWLETGDLGFVAGGELHVSGRAKDLVIVNGANHPPQAFEEALEGVGGVRTGCAVAVGYTPPGEDGEALLLLVEQDGSQAGGLEERIRASVVARTGVRPHGVVLLEPGTLPRTSSGKLRRGEALRRFQLGALSPPKAMGALGVAAEVARNAVALVRGGLSRQP